MDKRRLEKLLNFKDVHAVVLGDIMLDKYIIGTSSRISPEAPVPIVELLQRKYMLGGAANVAQNLKNLGANVSLIGVSGDDESYANFMKIAFQKQFENLSILKSQKRKTTTKIRIISNNQHLLRVDDEFINYTGKEDIKQVRRELLSIHKKSPIDIIILQDYNKGFFSQAMINSLMIWSKENEILTCLDPKTENINEFSGVNVFKPNLKEFLDIVGENDLEDKESLSKYANIIFDRLK